MSIKILKFFLQGTNFCGSAENRRRPLSELVYNIVMGFVGIFEYLHLKDGPTRIKYIFYYLLISVEAAALMTLWYLDTTSKVSKAYIDVQCQDCSNRVRAFMFYELVSLILCV